MHVCVCVQNTNIVGMSNRQFAKIPKTLAKKISRTTKEKILENQNKKIYIIN